VTAGIYLLLRFNAFGFEWLFVAGTATMVMAGLCACAEMDIKKIVALSTLSQLGVMMVALALIQKSFCFFHLITHALFKALLFLCVGVGIHSVFGSQDFRRFSALRSILI
jgi:NADH-ubiquinone oxidoreductase chain 5